MDLVAVVIMMCDVNAFVVNYVVQKTEQNTDFPQRRMAIIRDAEIRYRTVKVYVYIVSVQQGRI